MSGDSDSGFRRWCRDQRHDSKIKLLMEFEAEYWLRDRIRLTQGLRGLLGHRVEVIDCHALREELRAAVRYAAQQL